MKKKFGVLRAAKILIPMHLVVSVVCAIIWFQGADLLAKDHCRIIDMSIPLVCLNQMELVSDVPVKDRCEPSLANKVFMFFTGQGLWNGDNDSLSCFSGRVQCTAGSGSPAVDLKTLGLQDWRFSFECTPSLAEGRADFIRECLRDLELHRGISGYPCPLGNSRPPTAACHNYSFNLVAVCQGRTPDPTVMTTAKLEKCKDFFEWTRRFLTVGTALVFIFGTPFSVYMVSRTEVNDNTPDADKQVDEDLKFATRLAVGDILNDSRYVPTVGTVAELLNALYKYHGSFCHTPPSMPRTSEYLKNHVKKYPRQAVLLREYVKEMGKEDYNKVDPDFSHAIRDPDPDLM